MCSCFASCFKAFGRELSLIVSQGVENSQVIQHPGLKSPTSEVQARPLAGAPRLHKPYCTEEKKKERNRINIKQTYKQTKRMDGQNPMTNGKSNTKHTGTHNGTHTKKKEERIKRGIKEEGSNQTSKQSHK